MGRFLFLLPPGDLPQRRCPVPRYTDVADSSWSFSPPTRDVFGMQVCAVMSCDGGKSMGLERHRSGLDSGSATN